MQVPPRSRQVEQGGIGMFGEVSTVAAKRRCAARDEVAPGRTRPCPTLVEAGTTYCPRHTREYDARRGTTTARGYGHPHQRLRARWAPLVATGTVRCARCDELIEPDEPWDLGHDDVDRSRHSGPEHAARCNRAAAGRSAHRRP